MQRQTVYTNIDGLSSKLLEATETNRPDVIYIIESIDDLTLELKDYNISRKDRADGNGVGSNINNERNYYKGLRN